MTKQLRDSWRIRGEQLGMTPGEIQRYTGAFEHRNAEISAWITRFGPRPRAGRPVMPPGPASADRGIASGTRRFGRPVPGMPGPWTDLAPEGADSERCSGATPRNGRSSAHHSPAPAGKGRRATLLRIPPFLQAVSAVDFSPSKTISIFTPSGSRTNSCRNRPSGVSCSSNAMLLAVSSAFAASGEPVPEIAK